jgi:hypothetical protein
MAQIIKHRRGSISGIKNVTTRNAELIVASGSVSDLIGPFVFIGSPDINDEGVAGVFKSVSKIYQGTNKPTLAAGTYGSTLDGTPFYSTADQTLYILGNDGSGGSTNMDLTGNLEGRSIDKITLSSINGSIQVTGSIEARGNISASGDITASNLYLRGDANISGNIVLGGNINIGNQTTDLIVFGGEVSSSILPTFDNSFDLGSATLNWKDVHVSGTAFINTLKAGAITLNGVQIFDDLAVSGSAVFGSKGGGQNFIISSSLFVSGTTNFNAGDVRIKDNLIVTGSTSLGNDTSDLIKITGSLTLSGSTSFDAGNVRIKDNLTVSGSTFIGNDVTDLLNVTASVNISGSTVQTGSIFLKGSEIIENNLTVSGSTYLGDNSAVDVVQISASVLVKGTANFNSGNVSLTNNLIVSGGTIDTSYVATDIKVKDNTAGALSVKEGTNPYVTIDTTDGSEKIKLQTAGNVEVSGITTIQNSTQNTTWNDGALIVSGGVGIGKNLYVSGSATIAGNLTILGSSSIVNVAASTIQLGDNILELNGNSLANGGLYVKDPTGASTATGSLIWDSTNDYWAAGLKGAEIQLANYPYVSQSIAQLSASMDAATIFKPTGSVYATTNNIEITGSTIALLNSPDGVVSNKYALSVSQSIHAENINVGVPTSNQWQSNLVGSYFNNFTKNTDVSEILRFVAGLLSASAPDASPNTKFLSSVTANVVNNTTGTALTGYIPQSSTNTTITYLASKGFATAGSTLLNGTGTIYTNSAYALNYTSVAGGTTIVTSSADTQLFGLGQLSSGTPTNLKLSGSFTHRFMDNSTKTLTVLSSSQAIITQTGAGTTAGVTLAKILTVNPNVIPPAYQDGKFANAFTQSVSVTGSATNINTTGYYHISASLTIASGSSAYSTPITTSTEIFYAPLTTISTNVPAQTVYTSSVSTLSYVTAVSRSLSGAPYLSGSTYVVSSSLSGAFAPLFYNGNVAIHSLSGTGITQTSGVNTVATSGGTISTANAVYDSTGVTLRNTATIPFETDIIKLNGLYTFNGTAITNIAQSSFTPTTFTVSTLGYDFNGAADTYTNTLSYHVAGTFGQPAASGSLAYFTRVQGSDTSTALIESFTGESNRIQLADNVLAFGGTAWTTTFALNQLTGNDLQVKPGYLVKPGGTYGYWLGDPDTSKTNKYYVRKFTTSGTKTSMTLNLGQTLVNWGTTTNNAVGALILFESSGTNVYGAGNARLFDPSDLLSNFVATRTTNTDGLNPFGSNFQQYGNTGGSLATTTYTIPLRNGDGMTLNATYTNIYVIVRYKGDPTPVSSITTTFS